MVAVLTAADIPGLNDASPIAGDDPIFAAGKIEFHGQVVFAVVARTRDQRGAPPGSARSRSRPSRPLVSVEDALAARIVSCCPTIRSCEATSLQR